MSDLEILNRRIEREKNARKAAEALLEQKSRDLFDANRQLQDLAVKTRSIVDTAAEGIVTYDQSGRIELINRSAKHIFRCRHFQDRNIRDFFVEHERLDEALFHPSIVADPDEIDSGDEGIAEYAVGEPVEVVAMRCDRKTFPAEVSVGVHCREDGATYTVVIRDLSRRKKLERRLRQAQKMESVGQLAAGIAHEINTPIQFIGNNIQFLDGAFQDLGELLTLYDQLAQSVTGRSDCEHLLKHIEDQAELVDLPFLREEFPHAIQQTMDGIDRVAKIVSALKDFSQPSNGDVTELNLNEAIENTLAVSINQFRDIAEIRTELQPNLTSFACVREQMNQVILNVLTNSIEAIRSTEHRVPGEVVIATRQDKEVIQMTIEDNGGGISEEIRDRIFDPFFTTKEVGQGTGQGLAFVYDTIVNRHQGSVDFVSSPTGGTTFFITLPVSRRIESEEQKNEVAVV